MASSDIYTTATELAVLASGRAPAWTVAQVPTQINAPLDGAYGVPLQGAVRTLVHVALRENAHRRAAKITIDTLDLAATYTVRINNVATTYNAAIEAPADEVELLSGLADAINANTGVNQVVIASVTSGTGGDWLNIRGQTGYYQGWALRTTVTGSAVLVVEAEPEAAIVRLWWKGGAQIGTTPPAQWAASQDRHEIDWRGFLQRFDSAGLDRLHVQLERLVGFPGDGAEVSLYDARVGIGPCLSEVI